MKYRFDNRTKFIAFTAIFTAAVAAATIALAIPLPKSSGYINIGDTVIFVCAYFFGGIPAMLAGGLGSAIADLILGYAIFAPFTLIVKGLEGLIAGLLFKLLRKYVKEKFVPFIGITAMAAGGLEMIAGYFLTSLILYGLAAAASEILMNLIQAGVSTGLALLIILSTRAVTVIKPFISGKKENTGDTHNAESDIRGGTHNPADAGSEE